MSPITETPPRGIALATILLVDDDENSRIIFATALAHCGYHVITASDGWDAIRVAREMHPSVILLDIVMDGMDGNETMRALRADPATARIPAVAVTARALLHQRLEMLDAGFNEVLAKPVAPRTVVSAIEKVLGRS